MLLFASAVASPPSDVADLTNGELLGFRPAGATARENADAAELWKSVTERIIGDNWTTFTFGECVGLRESPQLNVAVHHQFGGPEHWVGPPLCPPECSGWELDTFKAMRLYLGAGPNTTLIDVGTWAGHMTACGGLLAARTHAFEPDPAAFAMSSTFVHANRKVLRSVHLSHAAMCPNGQSVADMAGVGPGNSMSRVGRRLQSPGAARRMWTWKSHCVHLESYLRKAALWPPNSRMLIKVDTESYECNLFSSLLGIARAALPDDRPSLHISMHPMFRACAPEEWDNAVELFSLYRFVVNWNGHGAQHRLPDGKERRAILAKSRGRSDDGPYIASDIAPMPLKMPSVGKGTPHTAIALGAIDKEWWS